MTKNAVFFTPVASNFYPFSDEIVRMNANAIDKHTMGFSTARMAVKTNARAVKTLIRKMRSEQRAIPVDRRSKHRPGSNSINPFTALELASGFVGNVKHGESFTKSDVNSYFDANDFVTSSETGIPSVVGVALSALIQRGIIKRVSRGVYKLTDNVVTSSIKVANKGGRGKSALTPVNVTRVYKNIPSGGSKASKIRSKVLSFNHQQFISPATVVRAMHGKPSAYDYQYCASVMSEMARIGLLSKHSRGCYTFTG